MRPWMYSNLMPAHVKHRCPARRQVCISKKNIAPKTLDVDFRRGCKNAKTWYGILLREREKAVVV
jgi:hypothetical protein